MRSSLFGLALAAVCSAPAQDFGKDSLAPYLPSPQVVVEHMLDAARIKAGETVYDLGSGDGRVVITAAQKYRAYAVGIEISDILCKSAMKRVSAMGLESQVK